MAVEATREIRKAMVLVAGFICFALGFKRKSSYHQIRLIKVNKKAPRRRLSVISLNCNLGIFAVAMFVLFTASTGAGVVTANLRSYFHRFLFYSYVT